ncbi:MAG: hypothetical protein QME60_03175 [Verrucomicrobiota bacterium]|nr:hypothetical protein [Verrucomicrobiota bacterium]
MNESADSRAVTSLPLGWIWAVAFCYTGLLAVMVQLVLLPHVFPAWHAGHGLLAGGDWVKFHYDAAALAGKIRQAGWGAWEIRPGNHGLVGVIGAVYALVAPEPWAMIPLNAALNATATVALVLIVQACAFSRRTAVWSCAPFLLYPSAMLWNTQMHNDGFFIAGAFLFLCAWIIVGREAPHTGWLRLPAGWGCALLGALLVWIVRPYGVKMMQGAGLLMALLVTGRFLWRARKREAGWRRAGGRVLVAWSLLLPTVPLVRHTLEKAVSPAASEPPPPSPYEWTPARWLPNAIDSHLMAMALLRDGSARGYPNAASNIDSDIAFHRAADVLAYAPRAAQIGFLAPFPVMWAKPGRTGAQTAMRRVAAIEMLGVYLALALLPAAFWRRQKREAVWLAALFSLAMLMLYAVVIVNVGSLYRVRYGFLMTFVALGISALVDGIRAFRRKHSAGGV